MSERVFPLGFEFVHEKDGHGDDVPSIRLTRAQLSAAMNVVIGLDSNHPLAHQHKVLTPAELVNVDSSEFYSIAIYWGQMTLLSSDYVHTLYSSSAISAIFGGGFESSDSEESDSEESDSEDSDSWVSEADSSWESYSSDECDPPGRC